MSQNLIESFFIKHNMHPEQINFNVEIEKLKQEMQKGLTTEGSSIMMLPTYIQPVEEITYNKPIITIDAGGTNLRVSLVTITQDGVLIEHFNKYLMPGAKEPVTKDEFYGAIADYITPILGLSDTISFCFSYPTQIMPNQDGKVLYMTKEVYIDGIEGTLLGENINEKLSQRGLENKRVVVLNDTVAAMLSGSAHKDMQYYEGDIGFILGTGMNACYAEKCENITKIKDKQLPKDKKMIINMEIGGYDKFPRGTADKILDESTKDPGRYQFEKMCAGAYLGDLIYKTAILAAQEELFSEKFLENLSTVDTFNLWEVAEFYENPYDENTIADLCLNKQETDNLLEIIKLIYQRVARFAIITLGAVMQKGEIGTNSEKPVAVEAEGTTFYKSPVFKKYLDKYTKEVLNDDLGLYCSYINVEDATLVGTAVSGLIPFI